MKIMTKTIFGCPSLQSKSRSGLVYNSQGAQNFSSESWGQGWFYSASWTNWQILSKSKHYGIFFNITKQMKLIQQINAQEMSVYRLAPKSRFSVNVHNPFSFKKLKEIYWSVSASWDCSYMRSKSWTGTFFSN